MNDQSNTLAQPVPLTSAQEREIVAESLVLVARDIRAGNIHRFACRWKDDNPPPGDHREFLVNLGPDEVDAPGVEAKRERAAIVALIRDFCAGGHPADSNEAANEIIAAIEARG